MYLQVLQRRVQNKGDDTIEPKAININGYDTYYVENQDNIGSHLLIAIPPYAEKNIADFCGTIICGHLINQIDYETINDNRYIKAYY